MINRWTLGGLLCSALCLFTLDSVGAIAPGDVVSDEEAAMVIGGACQCVTDSDCGGGSPCSGYGIVLGGTCIGKADSLTNLSVCGGCAYTVAANSSGCGGG